MSLMSLGLFVFELRTAPIDRIDRQSSYRWAGHAPISGDLSHQFLGRGEDKISLPGVLMPELSGGYSNLDVLRDMASTGKAYLLMRGDGSLVGNYFIRSISDTQTHFLDDGSAQKIEFNLALERYDDGQLDQLGDIGRAVETENQSAITDANRT